MVSRIFKRTAMEAKSTQVSFPHGAGTAKLRVSDARMRQGPRQAGVVALKVSRSLGLVDMPYFGPQMADSASMGKSNSIQKYVPFRDRSVYAPQRPRSKEGRFRCHGQIEQ